MDAAVVGDVVAVISQRRGKEWQEPQAGDPELLEIIELLDQPAEVTDAVAVRIEESLHMRFVDDRVLVPEGVAIDAGDHPDTVPIRRCSRERESLLAPLQLSHGAFDSPPKAGYRDGSIDQSVDHRGKAPRLRGSN